MTSTTFQGQSYQVTSKWKPTNRLSEYINSINLETVTTELTFLNDMLNCLITKLINKQQTPYYYSYQISSLVPVKPLNVKTRQPTVTITVTTVIKSGLMQHAAEFIF